MVTATLVIWDQVQRNSLIRGGLTALGEAGIMMAGLLIGCSESDADAWVWGLE